MSDNDSGLAHFRSHSGDPRFDSSVNRGDFNTKIGEGRVIRGIIFFQTMEDQYI